MREQIERALRGLAKSYTPIPDWAMFLPKIADALAEQAVTFKGELKYHEVSGDKWTNVYHGEGGRLVITIASEKHIGIPGKYFFIGVPLGEKK